MQTKLRSYLFLFVVIGLALLSGFLYQQNQFNYGLDIKGGVRLTYKIKFDKEKEAEQRANIGTIRDNLERVLQARVSAALGVVEGTVQAKGDEEFIVEIPGFTDAERARKTLSSTAKMIAYEASNVSSPGMGNRRYQIVRDPETKDGVPIQKFVDTFTDKTIAPGDPEYAAMIAGWKKVIEGDDLKRAAWRVEPRGTVPVFEFSSAGSEKMERWTRRAGVLQENLAFVLDGSVLSIAPLKEGVILTNEAFIDGAFDSKYVTSLANLLNAGALPVELVETSSSQVSPTIGEYALTQMVTAGVWSFGLIVLFLLGYYIFPGFVALIALVLYVLFTLTVMKLIGATFSLAAIAGFILSVGMAVDANILVFERLKEELKAGRSLATAADLGFKRAFPAILDSNVCTILTSGVLFFLGTGPVKGFASTLILGVALSLFTAVTCTRSILVFFVDSGIGRNPKLYGINRNWFGEKREATADTDPFKIMNRTKLWLTISVVTIIPGMIFMFMGGLKPNVEFSGGVEVEYVKPEGSNITADTVTKNLEAKGFEGPIIKESSAPGSRIATVKATAPEGVNAQDPELPGRMVTQLQLNASPTKFVVTGQDIQMEVLKPSGNAVRAEELKNRLETGTVNFTNVDVQIAERDISILGMTIAPKKGQDATSPETREEILAATGIEGRPISYSTVGPTIQEETISNAILGIALSTIFIVFWLTMRFGVAIGSWKKGLMFGLSAIGALVHDVLVVVGVAAIVGYFANWQVSTLFITSMLTVIGFSVHDTIVIFDRIRENLRKPMPGEDFKHLCDRSVTKSFARSINTSMTVITTLVLLIVIGTPTIDLKFFCLVMLVGIISGTYSSIFNATPILYLWDKFIAKSKGEDHTLIADAIKEDNRRRAAAQQAVATGNQQSFGTVKRRSSIKDKARQDID